MSNSDLEKAASGASCACGHFVAIFRTFWGKYSMILSEDRGRRLKDEDLGFIKGMENGGSRIQN